jgi:ABC-type branched-subunit amino acid transport system substrate-binding protein
MLAGLALSVGTTPVLAATPLKIGAILSQTGPLADFTPATANAIALAVGEINAAGGVLGAPMATTTADDQGDAKTAVEAAQHLLAHDKVQALLGPMSSAAFQAVATTVVAAKELPMISASATAVSLDGLDSKGFALRTVPSDVYQGAALAEVARDKGYGTISIAYVADDYGKGLAQSFTSAFTKAGGKIAASVSFAPKTAGDHDEPRKAAVGGAEALLVIAYPDDGASLTKGALEEGLFNKFLFSDGLMTQSVIDTVGGQFLDGASGATAQAPEDAPGHQAFEKAYAAKFGPLPATPYLGRTYDAVYLLALAAEKAKSTDGAKLRAALREVSGDSGDKIGPGEFAQARRLIAAGHKISYVGAAGPFTFDGHGGVTGGFAYWQIQDGKFETVRMLTPKM